MSQMNEGAVGSPTSRRRFEAGFWSVGFALLVVMALGTAPSPLYGLYEQRDGFSTFTITLIFAVYSLGSTLSLFFAGHVSDLFGRKFVLLPGLALGVASAAIFLWWRSLPGLYTGRFLTGVAVGVVSATATAFMAELHVKSKPGASIRRAQLGATVANLGGLAVGALVSGLLAQYVAAPLSVVYVVILSALGLSILAVAVTPETWLRPDPRPAYRPERIAVPPAARGQFFAATGAAAIAFAGLGLFTGLAGVLLVETLHRTSLALSGSTVFAVFAGAVLAQFLTLTWKRTLVLTAGIGAMLVGLGLVVTSMWLATPNLALFLVGGVIAGSGSGAVFKGSLGTVMLIAEPARRAESLAGVLLAGYLGLSIPAIGLGVALRSVSPKVTLLGFAIVVALATVAATPALLRGERSSVGPLASSSEQTSREPSTPPSIATGDGAGATSNHNHGGNVVATH
jgi:hypothetical protein